MEQPGLSGESDGLVPNESEWQRRQILTWLACGWCGSWAFTWSVSEWQMWWILSWLVASLCLLLVDAYIS